MMTFDPERCIREAAAKYAHIPQNRSVIKAEFMESGRRSFRETGHVIDPDHAETLHLEDLWDAQTKQSQRIGMTLFKDLLGGQLLIEYDELLDLVVIIDNTRRVCLRDVTVADLERRMAYRREQIAKAKNAADEQDESETKFAELLLEFGSTEAVLQSGAVPLGGVSGTPVAA